MDTDTQINTDAVNDEVLATLFHRAAKFMMRARHHKGHAEHAQMRVLSILQNNNNAMNQRDLLEILNVRSASLSELLGKLEHRHLIERNRDAQDKRNIVIFLTEQGSEAVKAIKAVKQDSASTMFATLSQSEREQLAELLQKVNHSFEDQVTKHRAHNNGEHEHRHEHEQNHVGRHTRDDFHHMDMRRHSRGGRRDRNEE
ncbi:MarR family winged helix-turn-helix transcriptional regulator [Neisseria sp. Ec49-e6-T10]|uniref:MarR family winged helix-turn-helix transcriptional regulator n=1 Tax=Neisseria sp. Ec49-e6-T10 TaxID=3140744 RepID=UPI003EBE08B7